MHADEPEVPRRPRLGSESKRANQDESVLEEERAEDETVDKAVSDKPSRPVSRNMNLLAN
jgi:hypothetical protein